jgi:hypothetical protein
LLWAFRALKRTAKLKPSLRDEEVSAFRAKVWVMTRFQLTGWREMFLPSR